MRSSLRVAVPLSMFFVGLIGHAARAAGCAPGFTDVGGGICSREFLSTGAPQTLIVPDGVGVITTVVSAGAGGTSLEDEGAASAGGLGGRMTATLPVSPGDTLTILLGQGGADGILQPSGFGGWPDGGHSASRYGGCGGGGSYLFDSTGLLVAAGGGGAGGHDYNPGWSATGNQQNWGGAGSGADGQDGNSVHFKGSPDPAYGSPGAGRGATTTGPGAGGTPDLPPSWSGFGTSTGESGWGPTESPDILGKGGDSYAATDTAGFGNGGGGGGGYYGGGGGGTIDSMVSGGGGGGGSGYVTPAAIASLAQTGVQVADGLVTISYDANQPPPPTTTSTTTSTTTATSAPTTSSTVATSSTTATTLAPGCGAAPAAACHTAAAGRSSITIVDAADPAKKSFDWKWNGDATALAEFKNPVAGTPIIELCTYDASSDPQPLARASIPPGGTCARKPCWKTLGRAAAPTGYKYKNPAATPDGIVAGALESGAAGKAQVRLKAKGSALRNPVLGLALPVTVQLVISASTGTVCWRTTFATARTNGATKFKAKGP